MGWRHPGATVGALKRGGYPKAQWLVTLLLLIATVVFLVLHLVLDAGDDEAPGWILPLTTMTALACTLVAAMSSRRE